MAEVVEDVLIKRALLFVPAEQDVAVGELQRDLRVTRRGGGTGPQTGERRRGDLRLFRRRVEPDHVQIHLREFGRRGVLFPVSVEDSVGRRAVEELDRLLALALQLARRVLVREDEREQAARYAGLRVGRGHVAVELQVAERQGQPLAARVREQLEELVENLRAFGRTLLKLTARDERVEEERGRVAVAPPDEQARGGRQLLRLPLDAARGARPLDSREDAVGRLVVGVLAEVEEPDGGLEV